MNWMGGIYGRDCRLHIWGFLLRRGWDAEKGKWEWWNLCKSLVMKVCPLISRLCSRSAKAKDRWGTVRGRGGRLILPPAVIRWSS